MNKIKKDRKNIVLLVCEDVLEVQTYSGFLGRIFKSFYLTILLWRLRLFLILFKRKSNIILLSSLDYFQKNASIKNINYSEKITKIDAGKYREKSWKIIKNLSNRILSIDRQKMTFHGFEILFLWKRRAAIQLSYHYFPYLEVINNCLKKYQPKQIFIFGRSKQEKIAKNLAKKNNIQLKKFYLFDLSWLNNFIKKYLFSREIEKKTEEFIQKSKQKKININKYKNSYLLSVDFFRHLKMLVPLYKKFCQKGKKVLFVSDIPKIDYLLKQFYGIDQDYCYLAEQIPYSLISGKIKASKKKFKILWQKHWKIIVRQKDNETFEAAELMLDYFEIIIKQVFPLSELYLEAAEKLIKIIKPAGIICVNDLRFSESAFLKISKKYKIKTLIGYPGMFLEKNSSFDTDYFSAIGENTKKELLSIGYPIEKIFINGDPQLDFLKNKNLFHKKRIYKKLSLNINKKIILLISDRINPKYTLEEKRKQFKIVSEVLEKNPNVQLVIKPHPTEERTSLLADLQNWQIKNALVTNNQKIELFELLSVSSSIIIAWSMAGFEAILMNVPVIVANFSQKDYDFQIPYVKEGGAVKAANSQELLNYINLFIDNRNQERKRQVRKAWQFCAYYYRFPLGNAAERIYKLFEKS